MPLPPSLLHSLEGIKGFDRIAFESIHASGAQLTSVRLNPFKTFARGEMALTDQVAWCEYAYYLPARPSFTFDPLFHGGAYYVQEASSMFLWHVLKQVVDAPTSQKVLDLCSAPGGKSTLLASYFPVGLIVANEVIKARSAVLVENITKWGTQNVIVTNNDPSHFQSLPEYFDLMVVDAPCSGSGLFRKDTNAITEWSEDNVQLCSQRQQRILADALPALKQEGILIYSTCSYSPQEDEQIADWLVSEMQMESIEIPAPHDWGIVETRSQIHRAFGYRFYPNKVRGEGFYIAAFRKSANTESRRLKEQQLTAPTKQETAVLADFISVPVTQAFFKQADAIRTIPQQWLETIKQLAGQLYIKKAGIEIGTVKGKDLIPAHELALSLLPLDNFSSVSLQKEDALQYLRRKEIPVPETRGWNLVRYNTLPLGWIKVLPNRVNNYYPAEWRILKN